MRLIIAALALSVLACASAPEQTWTVTPVPEKVIVYTDPLAVGGVKLQGSQTIAIHWDSMSDPDQELPGDTDSTADFLVWPLTDSRGKPWPNPDSFQWNMYEDVYEYETEEGENGVMWRHTLTFDEFGGVTKTTVKYVFGVEHSRYTQNGTYRYK